MKHLSIASAIALTLAGCAHSPPVAPKDIFFDTKIESDSSKVFSISIPLPGKNRSHKSSGQGREKKGNRNRGDMGSGMPNKREADNSDKVYEALLDALDDKLAETGYCTTGYMEVDTHQSDTRFHLLGECNESASAQDKVHFPNAY
ncbi:hypothetical protein [Aestuariibacter sp. A3R04]|uniref:hypothetical protein n=1 Tax=Aestuariibacter sp. A3R04 TaxID=2841571 RepID=UPI001C09BF86|nr:hypothetical protein [Aestuariibacter sp. A3R04]MBU3021677.1 hypothetical protein [Aestuariibacter sp. A3R04]